MIDAEILVRFLGFYLGPVAYRGNLKLFLDGTCKSLNERWDVMADAVQGAVRQMEEAIDAARAIFGGDGACHKWSGTRWERSFNRAIFDVQINSLADPTARAAAIAAGGAVMDRFKSLCVDDTDFSRSISTTTKSLDATSERFSKWYAAISTSTGVELTLPSCLRPAEG